MQSTEDPRTDKMAMPAVATHLLRTSRIMVLALVALLCGLALSASRAAADPLAGVGVYTGSGNVSGFDSVAGELGGSPAYALDFLPGGSWSEIENPSWYVGQWSGSGAQVVLSVPMLPASGATLATGATGTYDGYFQTLAQNLVVAGDGSGIIRLGWEFNGNWFPWTIAGGNAANYAAYWRQIVTTMRAVAPNLRFDWCANSGSSSQAGAPLDAEAAYPGDQYVDYIGMDQYDQSYISDTSTPAQRWNGWVSQPYGLAWQRSFAAAHGKPVSFPEWGLSSGGTGVNGGDDPSFIEDMHNWIESSDLAYESYFDFNAGDGDHALADFPHAAATYYSLFGASAPHSAGAPIAAGTGTGSSGAAATNGSGAATPAPTLSATVASVPSATVSTGSATATGSASATGRRAVSRHHRNHTALRLASARHAKRLVLRWRATHKVLLERGDVLLGTHTRSGRLALSSVRPGSYRACLLGRPHVCSAARTIR